MSRTDLNLIEEDGKTYGIRVLGRGNDLLFKENNKGLLCEIDAEHGIIYKKSIQKWDSTNEKMTKSERERVSDLIFKFYRKVYNADVQLK